MSGGPIISGSGCPHRFRGATLETSPNLVRAPPTSVHRVTPPADFDTPRSPDGKEISRNTSPSTVPQVLSGTPGSPVREVSPGFEPAAACGGSAAASGVVTPQMPLCLEHNWKFSLDPEHASLGVNGDFVHVDEDQLPNGLQDLRRAHATAPAGSLRDPAARGPLSNDISNVQASESEFSNVSFNLSPIKRTGAPLTEVNRIDFTSSAVCKCGKGPGCRCCSRPPSPLQGLHAPPPPVTGDFAARSQALKDRENRAPVPESKVAAMRNLWEQRSGSATPNDGRGRSSSTHTYNVVVGRGRSSSREGLCRSASFDDERVRRVSQKSQKLCNRLKKQEEDTKHNTRVLEDLLRRLDAPYATDEQDSPEHDEDSISDALSPGVGDSPTTKMCRDLSKQVKSTWKQQKALTKAVMKVVTMDANLSARPCASCAGAMCTAAPAMALFSRLEEEVSPASPQMPGLFPLPSETCKISSQPLLTQQLSPLLLPDTAPAPAEHLKVNAHFLHCRRCSLEWKVPGPKDGRCDSCDEFLLDGSLHESPPTTPQPEEEADGPLPRKSNTEEIVQQPLKSKLLAAEEALLSERAFIEGSRNSTISDAEPAREPQPLTPRDAIEELSVSTDTPMLESPGGGTSSSFQNRPSASGPEHEEGLVTEADSSQECSVVEEASAVQEESVDYSADYKGPCEDGMDRAATMLHYIEQTELKRELYIQVPAGIGADRKVTFTFENKSHEVAVPEGYEIGAQVLITLTNRPFLERTAAQAQRRGHAHELFPFQDRWAIVDSLRHSLRTDKDASKLDSDEFRNRYNLYTMLRGRCGAPLLPFTEEETETASEVGAY